MCMRHVLLLCLLLVASAADSRAQGASPSGDEGPVVYPNSKVHHITSETGRTFVLYVQLPESYAANDTTTYPVLYLTDAEAELLGTFTGLTYFLRFTDNIRDVILVAVADGGIRAHFDTRRLDYTPTMRPPASNPSGGAAAYLAFLRDRAIPFIEARYRADPGDRGIWGHSLAGLFATYALLEDSGTFHRYLISSPSLYWDDRLMVKRAAAYDESHQRLPGRVYTAFGADEPASDVEAWELFNARLRAGEFRDLHFRADLVPEADHLTVMPTAFVRGMKAVYGLRPIEATLDSVIAAEGIEAAKRLYHHLAATEPREHNFAEAQLNRLGYRLLRADRITEAIEIFRLNVERYPLSANVYDSLGEAYMEAGDYGRAIENYRRSLELDPENSNATEMLKRLEASPAASPNAPSDRH